MWKSRIYGFLFRRILGPYLTPASKQRLAKSINVSLSEGRLELFHVELDGRSPALLSKLDDAKFHDTMDVDIQKIHVQRMCIVLSLLYFNDRGEVVKEYESGKARLIAHVELDGVDVHVNVKGKRGNASGNGDENVQAGINQKTALDESGDRDHAQEEEEDTTLSSSSLAATSRTIRSYVQSALDSLKLSLDINDVTIRISTPDDTWVKVNVATVSYRDSERSSTSASASNPVRKDLDLDGVLEDNSTVTVLEKEIGVDTVTITVGETLSPTLQTRQYGYGIEPSIGVGMTNIDTHCSEEVMRLDGITTIQMIVKSSPIVESIDEGGEQKVKLERNCIVTMDQELVLNAGIDTLKRIQRIMSEINCVNDVDPDPDAAEFTATDSAKTGVGSEAGSNRQDATDDDNDRVEKDSRQHTQRSSTDTDSMDSDRDLDFLTNIIQQRTDEQYMDNFNVLRNRVAGNDLTYEENDEGDGDGDGDEHRGSKRGMSKSVDAQTAAKFFDTNEGGYSHYCSVLEGSINEDENRYHGEEKVGLVSTRFQFHLRQASTRIHLQPTNGIGAEAFVSVDFQGLNISSRKTRLHQNIHFEIAGFACEHSRLLTYGDSDEVSSILQFETEHDHADAGHIISASPPLSLNVDVRESDDGETYSDIHVTLKPVFFTYNPMIMSDLQKSFCEIPRNKSDEATSHQELSPSSVSSIKCQVTCNQINVIMPIEVIGEMHKKTMSSVSADLCRRSGYEISLQEPLLNPALSLEISEFNFDFASGLAEGQGKDEAEDMQASVSFQRSVLSFIVPVEQSGAAYAGMGQKFDFIALESETMIDPDAIVRIEYSNSQSSKKSDVFMKERAKRKFPLVTPLASVKASQNCGNKDQDDESMNSPELNAFGKNKLRGSDPQIAMLKDLLECEQMFSVHIPSLAVDLSVAEKDAILRLLSCIPKKNGDTNDDECATDTTASPLNMSFRCDQLSITMHQNNNEDDIVEDVLYSYTLICDGFKSHVLLDQSELKNTRLVCHDMTLFEVQGQPSSITNTETTRQTVKQMCELIRKRRGERSGIATPIFFRSKLSQCLSPTTPAIIFDLLVQSDDYHMERAVHISVYDMTYRYDCEGRWLSRVMDLIKPNESLEESKGIHSNLENNEHEEMAIVNNIFATVSDCNIDYTSPTSFITPSRTILRLGEVRFTSNVIVPSGPAQVFKITVADVAVHVSNKRVGHEVENAKVSCASIFQNSTFSTSEGDKKSFPHSLDDALLRMDFVRIASLDFFESTITKVNENRKQNAPDSTALCSIGRVSIYACRDSFVCFTETINEAVLKLTMPTCDELEVLRRDFFNSKRQSSLQERKETELPIEEETSYLIQQPTPLAGVMENGLFTSMVLEEESQSLREERIEENRNLIDDFFSADRKPSAGVAESPSEKDINDDDWTSVHHAWANDQSIPDNEEQAARWYPPYDEKILDPVTSLMLPKETKIIVDGGSARQPRIFSHHVPIDPVTHPSAEGDMGAARFIGSTVALKVTFQLLVQDMCLDCRFFDGFDWPRDQTRMKEVVNKELMNDLLGDNGGDANIFSDAQNKRKFDTTPSRLTRRYFQFSFKGLKLRLDSFADSPDHSLSSCMDLSLSDMYLIETISSRGTVPVKLLGEWVHDDHTRDSNDGLMALKLFSMLPDEMFSSDGKLMGNEGRATLEFLPIRFLIHQVALRFIRGFFRHDDGNARDQVDNSVTPPEMFFPLFRVKPFNIKVDYKPKTVNTAALKNGSLVELLNVLPLEDMILRLSEVEMRNLTGWGSIISELACNWLADVSSTQMHKFLTRTTPLHPFATVGDGMKQFLMIPLEEYKQKGNVKRGFRKGTKKLASVLAYETLSVGARLTGFAAKALGKRKSKTATSLNGHVTTPSQTVPSLPRSMDEVSDHALESLARGLKEANAKIIIIPYREFQKSGTRGAVKCVVKGLPVAVCAPLSGAAEAVSYSLYGVRNQLRPDLLEEEEASKRLHNCDIQF